MKKCKMCPKTAVNRFCSSACSCKFLNKNKNHQRKAGIAGGAHKIALRGTGTKTYVKELGRHQHRVVMERILGRKLKSTEIVHHKDSNKKNNHPSNLEVMSQSKHIEMHRQEMNHARRMGTNR